MTEPTLILASLAAFIAGTALAAIFMHLRTSSLVAHARTASATELGAARERASKVAPLEARVAELSQSLSEAVEQAAGHRESMARLQAELASERQQSAERQAFAEEATARLTEQFRNLANDIMEEKGKRFTEQNETNLGNLLGPLRQKLAEFQDKVELVYVQEGKDRSMLAEQVRQLAGLNNTLSEDARNLATALKGSNKTQGSWGEMVLARVLESSGLREGHEYHPQQSHTQEDGRRLQPDVVVQLPRGRSLVIDSKVSLTAYEAHVSATDDAAREASQKEHIASLRTHVRGLQKKQYQAIYQLKTLDFVVMFVPVEPAFMLAANHGGTLLKEAWDSGVLLVSPSTLMFVLRMVDHLWRQEAQDRNAQDIAKRGAELYDKLSAFTEDLANVGTRLRQAQAAYDQASRKLSRGRGNVISQAEQLRSLGIQPTKGLNVGFLNGADEDDDAAGAGGMDDVHAPDREIDAGVDTESVESSTATAEIPATSVDASERSPRPGTRLARAHDFVRDHIDTHAPADIRRMMAEQLDLKPNVANTYFYQAKSALAAVAGAGT